MPAIKAVVSYCLDGQKIDYFPSSSEELDRIEPVYKEFKGWQSDTTATRDYDELHPNAKAYISFIEEYLNVPVNIVSIGPERESIIERKKLFQAPGSPKQKGLEMSKSPT